MEEEGLKFDKWGYPVKTYSEKCIAAINDFYEQVLTYGRKRSVIVEAASHDNYCVLANVLAAQLLFSSDPPGAQRLLSSAKSSYDRATAYEKAVFDAVSYLMSDDKDDDVAIDLHAKLLNEFPRDLASLKRAQILCFYGGQPSCCLEIVNQVKRANQEASYFHGMLAFPLLELGKFEDAEEAARMALQINKQDVWAQHCLCHVLQQKCRFEEAVTFMESSSHTWDSCSSFMYTHNWWHVALCYLEGHSSFQKVLEIYDKHIVGELDKPDAVEAEVYVNALGLLLRMHVRGQIGLFDHHLKAMVTLLTTKKTWYVEWQLDLLSVWALSCFAEEKGLAEALLEGLRCRLKKLIYSICKSIGVKLFYFDSVLPLLRVSKMNKKKQQLMQKALLLAAAMYSYGKGKDEQALTLFGMDFDAQNYKVMIGASDEQLDVFNEVWYCLLLNNGHPQKVIESMERRLKEREGVSFLWRLLEKSCKMLGKEDEAGIAADKANMLEKTYFK
ncbi:hypothetical protein V2J09_015403 [Rumex salicifolius]